MPCLHPLSHSQSGQPNWAPQALSGWCEAFTAHAAGQLDGLILNAAYGLTALDSDNSMSALSHRVPEPTLEQTLRLLPSVSRCLPQPPSSGSHLAEVAEAQRAGMRYRGHLCGAQSSSQLEGTWQGQ